MSTTFEYLVQIRVLLKMVVSRGVEQTPFGPSWPDLGRLWTWPLQSQSAWDSLSDVSWRLTLSSNLYRFYTGNVLTDTGPSTSAHHHQHTVTSTPTHRQRNSNTATLTPTPKLTRRYRSWISIHCRSVVKYWGFKLALFTILFPYATVAFFPSFRRYQHAGSFVCPLYVNLWKKNSVGGRST
jgi:hypothetical protein